MDDSNDPSPRSNVPDERWAGISESVLREDAMFEALAHERRRYLLYTLLENDSWTLEELARKVTAWEVDRPERNVAEEDIDRVYASLYHAHVPKLADLNIIEFDRQSETITKGTTAEQVLRVLELTGASDANQLEKHARGDEDD